jgi:cell division protein FtsI (penicillin-binding protein 3)
MSENTRYRLIALAILLALIGGLIVAQLVRLQILEQPIWENERNRTGAGTLTLPAQRGRIWDHDGNLLADNIARYQVTADPGSVDVSQVVNKLAPILQIPSGEMRAKLADTSQQTLLATRLSLEVGEQIRRQRLWAVYSTPYWQRAYPEHELLSHVLGFVNAQGKGYYGVEGQYDTILRGHQQVLETRQDAFAQPSPFEVPPLQDPRNGMDLVLTIDRTFQALTEAELGHALAATGAKSGTIIVMDPRTGAILAMASRPTFDPNDYTEIAPERFVNPAASAPYEPGSTFKIVTMAAALQEGKVTPESTYNDTACLEVGGLTVCNWDRKAHGLTTMVDLLAQSLNVGAARLARQLGGQTFYRYVQAFGIGQYTEVDLQGEAQGSLRMPGDLDWHESDLAVHSFGQGLSTTPLQMISAVSAVANDGLRMRPYVVAQKIDGKETLTATPTPLSRVITPQTAHTLTAMLEQAMERESSPARVPGYRIAGKTGTAQIPIPGGYDDPWTIASFIGWGPVSDPRLIILVKLDRPTTSPWGSTTAAPVFSRLAGRMFILMGMPPDKAQASR